MSPQQIEDEARRLVGRGLTAAAVFLANRVKETLSVPAPRRRVRGRDGTVYYRAATPATAGAPPRKVTGRFRSMQTYEVSTDGTTARVGNNHPGGRRLEAEHPYLVPTFKRYEGAIAGIVAGELRR